MGGLAGLGGIRAKNLESECTQQPPVPIIIGTEWIIFRYLIRISRSQSSKNPRPQYPLSGSSKYPKIFDKIHCIFEYPIWISRAESSTTKKIRHKIVLIRRSSNPKVFDRIQCIVPINRATLLIISHDFHIKRSIGGRSIMLIYTKYRHTGRRVVARPRQWLYPIQGSSFRSPVQANQAFHPSWIGETVPDLSRKDKMLTCSLIGHCKLLHWPNTYSDCLHDVP